MVETKSRKNLNDDDVKIKSETAKIHCNTATDFNNKNGGKEWEYILLPHDKIFLNSSFKYLVENH